MEDTEDTEIVSASQARNHFAQLLDRVEKGEKIAISRRGKTVATLVAMARPLPKGHEVMEVVCRWRAIRDGRPLTLGGVSWKELRDEGRR